MTTPIAEMTDDEIVALLSKGTSNPRTHAFVCELFETYEPEEIPEVLRALSRAAHALRDYPVDADLTDLSLRQLGPVIGIDADLPNDFQIPGVTDRVPNAFDIPLRELDRKIGPAEFRYYVRAYEKTLDAERAAALRALENVFRFH